MSGVRWPFCATIAFAPPIVRPASNDDCGFRLLAARIVGIFFSRETRDVICVHRGRFAAAAGQRRGQHAVGEREHGGCTAHVRTAPCRQQGGGVGFASLLQRLDSGLREYSFKKATSWTPCRLSFLGLACRTFSPKTPRRTPFGFCAVLQSNLYACSTASRAHTHSATRGGHPHSDTHRSPGPVALRGALPTGHERGSCRRRSLRRIQ